MTSKNKALLSRAEQIRIEGLRLAILARQKLQIDDNSLEYYDQLIKDGRYLETYIATADRDFEYRADESEVPAEAEWSDDGVLTLKRSYYRDSERVFLALINSGDAVVTDSEVAHWSDEQRKLAAEWVISVAYSASDNSGVKVPPRPDFIRSVQLPKSDGTEAAVPAQRLVPRQAPEILTNEQIGWLQDFTRQSSFEKFSLIAAFYHKVVEDEGLPKLQFTRDLPALGADDDLALNSVGQVACWHDGEWLVIDHFPGWRLENGQLKYAVGVWPPIVSESEIQG